jgi:serine/threonine protein kinase
LLAYEEVGSSLMCLDGVPILEDETSYIVSELAHNGDLFDFVQEAGGLPENIAKNIFRQLVDGVEYLHE